jgi:hypothetical protein
VTVAIDVIPTLGRPAEVERAIDEARELRDRHRLAQEEQAQAQQALEQAHETDVAAAAERVRKGSAVGALPPAIEKAKHVVALAERNALAIGLAARAAREDVGTTIAEHADDWLKALDAGDESARQRARDALVALEAALGEVSSISSARLWLDGGSFDRPPQGTIVAADAPSSRKRTANSQAVSRDEILSWARELIDPPQAPVAPQLGVPAG